MRRKAVSGTTIPIENALLVKRWQSTLACVNQLRCFGDLVADLAAQAAAGLRKVHSDISPGMARRIVWHGSSFPDKHSGTWSGWRNPIARRCPLPAEGLSERLYQPGL